MSLGGDTLAKPLPARTNLTMAPQVPKDGVSRSNKADAAKLGSFSSLRQYGKFMSYTSYGSIFHAANPIKLAMGEGAQYSGQFDGKSIDSASAVEFGTIVKRFIDAGCPLIVPFDVSVETATSGDPTASTGEAAHWTVVVGYLGDALFHFHWGSYRECLIADMTSPCRQLTANCFLPMRKVQFSYMD